MKGGRIILIAALCACILPLCACREDIAAETKDRLVVASFYPIYSLTNPVLKDVPYTNLCCLVQPQDGCLRDYALSEWDVSLLSLGDVVVLGGRGLERFENALAELGESGPAVVSAMNGLVLIEDDQNASDDETGHSGPNPWLYLSVDGAGAMVEQIAASFSFIDPDHREAYLRNAEGTKKKLADLKDEMERLIEDGRATPVALLCEGLAYFARDLSLNVVCDLPREPYSTLTQDEFAAVADELRESGAAVALIERQAPSRLKNDLREAGFVVCPIDTLTTRMPDGDENGYIDAMLFNAASLKDAYNAYMH